MFTVENVKKVLEQENYYIDEDLALVVAMAEELEKPLLLEGPAGVGKTDLGRALARGFNMEFIRLQCYEGLDEHHALYEWNYQKQLLYLENQPGGQWDQVSDEIFSQDFLLPRPMLKAFLAKEKAVLLIDEIDKSDEAFESFLLEALSDYAVTIPEWGTVTANKPPLVILTSNGVRDFSDGLKRRCVHYYIDYPDKDRELAIIKAKIPHIGEKLADEAADFLREIRLLDLRKKPSTAEALDWAKVLVLLGIENLNDPKVQSTYNFLLKYEGDLAAVKKYRGSKP